MEDIGGQRSPAADGGHTSRAWWLERMQSDPAFAAAGSDQPDSGGLRRPLLPILHPVPAPPPRPRRPPQRALHTTSAYSCTELAKLLFRPPPHVAAMCELLSLSVLQVLSLLSFLTSVLAVLCVGTGSLHRLSHRLDKFEAESGAQTVAVDAWKVSLWNWGMLPLSSSLGTLLGEEDMTSPGLSSGYTGGAELTRMNWQMSRPRPDPRIYDVKGQPPLSMAKIIMSRHSQRRTIRLPRRLPGSPRPTPPSRLMESFV